MDEIDKATTEYSVEIKKPTPPAVPSEDEIKKKKEIGTLPDLPEPETIVIDTDIDQASDLKQLIILKTVISSK